MLESASVCRRFLNASLHVFMRVEADDMMSMIEDAAPSGAAFFILSVRERDGMGLLEDG